jgi:hypothetical protein
MEALTSAGVRKSRPSRAKKGPPSGRSARRKWTRSRASAWKSRFAPSSAISLVSPCTTTRVVSVAPGKARSIAASLRR